jgi:hypothetical protein
VSNEFKVIKIVLKNNTAFPILKVVYWESKIHPAGKMLDKRISLEVNTGEGEKGLDREWAST